MAKLIRKQRVAADNWQRLELGADGALPSIPAEGDVIVPLKAWLARHDSLAVRAGNTGVWLDANEGPEAIAADLKRLPLIAVRFPSHVDGRGYSTARLLRERYGYAGELRAFGDVGRDHVLNMQRCGFDAFELREGEDEAGAIAAFAELPEAYQASVTEPQPLLRRRLANA